MTWEIVMHISLDKQHEKGSVSYSTSATTSGKNNPMVNVHYRSTYQGGIYLCQGWQSQF